MASKSIISHVSAPPPGFSGALTWHDMDLKWSDMPRVSCSDSLGMWTGVGRHTVFLSVFGPASCLHLRAGRPSLNLGAHFQGVDAAWTRQHELKVRSQMSSLAVLHAATVPGRIGPPWHSGEPPAAGVLPETPQQQRRQSHQAGCRGPCKGTRVVAGGHPCGGWGPRVLDRPAR